MNTIFKRVISGAAALGIAVSGLAIGVSTAYAASTSQTLVRWITASMAGTWHR